MEKTTRFMEAMFSNTDENAAKQVDNDIKTAQREGEVDDTVNNLKYENTGNGVAITDKETGEVTLAKKADDADDTYDLVAVPDGELEKYLHPSDNGRRMGKQKGAADEDVKNHFNGEDNTYNPEEDVEGEDEKKFSVYTDNAVVQRIFSDQEYCERIFSEVLETGETARVGELVVENLPEEGALKVTNTNTDDAAVVKYDEETGELVVDEKTATKEFGEFEALHVVGVEPVDHLLVDAPVYSEEDADELVRRLEEDGVENIRVFECADEARDYAVGLLDGLGVESTDDIEEPEQVEYSAVGDIFVTRYYSDNTWSQVKMFSEEIDGITELRSAVLDAIEDGDQIETDEETITPIDAKTAVIKDKVTGEFTKATALDDEDLELENISRKEASKLMENLEVEEEEEKKYSDMTDYMVRLYSADSDQEAVEDAIDNGDQVETDDEVITPIDAKTAVVEDKENGEFTKVTVVDDDTLDVQPIEEKEAKKLTENLEVEDTDEDEDEDEKKFSEIYTNEAQTRFFSENEEMTDYMVRLFSEESDQNAIEDAIENGDQVETDDEVITPIDAKTAIVEDKKKDEFTKVTVLNDDELDVVPISKEEAEEVTKNLEVEDTDEDEDKKEKKFSNNTLQKFFAEALTPDQQQQPGPVVQEDDDNDKAEEEKPSVEEVEDKALAAVQSIKAAAEEAAATIMDAKAAPAPEEEPNLQEAQFTQKSFSKQPTLVSWLDENNK